MLQNGADIDTHRDGMRMLHDGGRIIYYDKEVGSTVAMSNDVAWV